MIALARSHIPVTRSELPWAIRHGAMAGVIAGLAFAAFEMAASAVMMGGPAFAMPLRMIGAIAMGSEALDPGYPLAMAALAGVAVHMMLSMIYGAVFATLAGGLRSGLAIIGLASVYGLALWLINFYLIAPVAFPWFTEANPMMQFVGHVFFFGSVLGYALWRSHEGLLRRAP